MCTLLTDTFHCLLADCSRLTGLHLVAPDGIGQAWLTQESAALDKGLLKYLEDPSNGVPQFPDWLMPLWEKFEVSYDPELLRVLRQILVFCYKAEFEPSYEQRIASQEAFVQNNNEVGFWNSSNCNRLHSSHLLREARRIIGSVIHRINWTEITPFHGPGAVYPPRKPWEKSDIRASYAKLSSLYPLDYHSCGLPSFWNEVLVDGDFRIQELASIEAKLVCVPKDSRGPRLICVHPSEAIRIQQGQRKLLESAIARHPSVSKAIRFDDQTVNGQIALESSRTREFCTLDLKDASDRIPKELVRYLFGDAYRYLEASRADTVKLLDGRVINVEAFAPMGNCLTFPVESLVFYAMVRAGIQCRYGSLKANRARLYIFGDDVIFPTEVYDGVIRALVSVGLIPNTGKTFRKGLFRESCGVDAFNGVDITPLRIRKVDVVSASSAVGLCSLAKRLTLSGYHSASSKLYSYVTKQWGRLPLSNNPECQGICQYNGSSASSLFIHEPSLRFNRETQVFETRTRLLRSCISTDFMHDWYHVQDSLVSLLRRGEEPSVRGQEYPIPYRTQLVYGDRKSVV